MKRVGVILLAAGGSRRMGSSKVLLPVDGVPLVREMASRCLALKPAATCVIIGAESERVRLALEEISIDVVYNLHWQTGIGSSIACGVKHLARANVDGAMIVLCDQPAIPQAHFESLLARVEDTSADIVATEYADSLGVPAVFDRSLFRALESLEGDRGAKHLLSDPSRNVVRVRCDAAKVDLDTPEDVERFRRR